MNLLIFGPQGCGKGTQADKLSDRYHLVHVETGKIFREIAKEETPLGKKVSDISEKKKELIPDDIVVEVLREKLKKVPVSQGIILDSAPRAASQIEGIEKMLGEIGRPINVAISITLPYEESIARISRRYLCPNCHKQFVLGEDFESTDSLCPSCGEKIRQRLDDTPDGVKKRLETFHNVTQPVVEHYRQKGMLIEVDGKQNIEKVFKDIIDDLDK